jgi:hypothetical protein
LFELARSFGRIASDYDVARPEYAPEAVDRAAEVLGLGADSRVLPGAEVVELYSTTSAVAWLPVSERAELKRELLPLLGDTYRLKITTVLYWGRRG